MRKSTLFISAALTAFMLAVLFGVASAYQNITKSTQTVAAQSQSQPTAVVEAASQPILTQAANVTPEEAAAVASKVLSRTDLYSVENAPFENVDSYLVTFSSGDLVYVSLQGQILSISKLPVTVINQPVLRKHRNNGNDGASVSTPPTTTTPPITGGGDDGGDDHGGDD